ncbi:MAG: rRNA pseudouridine synthase [Acidobacteria bacterium]|nr:rRNA pseudouridine synthase [Acidobacteriota bacterium]
MTGNRRDNRRTGLARALSKLGYCSRSEAATLIRRGRVRVNGRVILDPEKPILPARDRIEVEGKPIGRARKVYFMVNKPRGLVSTAHDEKGRKTIYSLLPEGNQWVAPVGRLDMASEGLLLVTNDSEWGARIASPASHLEKTYHVQIAAVATEDLVDRLRQGVHTKDGDFLRAKRVSVLRHGQKNSWLEIVLEEGRNRHIRRMLGELELEVLRLVRVSIGGVELGDLPKGKARELREEERRSLAAAFSRNRPGTGGRG